MWYVVRVLDAVLEPGSRPGRVPAECAPTTLHSTPPPGVPGPSQHGEAPTPSPPEGAGGGGAVPSPLCMSKGRPEGEGSADPARGPKRGGGHPFGSYTLQKDPLFPPPGGGRTSGERTHCWAPHPFPPSRTSFEVPGPRGGRIHRSALFCDYSTLPPGHDSADSPPSSSPPLCGVFGGFCAHGFQAVTTPHLPLYFQDNNSLCVPKLRFEWMNRQWRCCQLTVLVQIDIQVVPCVSFKVFGSF